MVLTIRISILLPYEDDSLELYRFGLCKVQTDGERIKLNKEYKPDVLCLLERKAETPAVQKVGRSLKFSGLFEVPTEGMAGGIALYWKSERVNLVIIGATEQCIHTEIEIFSLKQLVSFVYVMPNGTWKDRFWLYF